MVEASKRLKAVVTVLALAAALLTLGAHSASGVTVTQDGPVNYIGPGPCPAGTTDCTITSGDVDVVQKAPSGGSNTIDCRGASCVGTQSGTTSADKPTNDAKCVNEVAFTTNADANTPTNQVCDIDQTGGSNKLNANLTATANTGTTADPCTNSLVNLATVVQKSRQRFITTQTGDTNNLTVKGNITQCASSVFDATSPVSHTQSTAILAENTMNAAISNVADFDLKRIQNSNATGASPNESQDGTASASTPADASIVDGLGKVVLKAISAGTNALTLRGLDKKDEQATSLDLGAVGPVDQLQGHDQGGWIVDLSGSDSGVPPSDPNVADADLGRPDGSPGFQKIWTQHAVDVANQTFPSVQAQHDILGLPGIGKSLFRLYSHGLNKLTNDEGGFEDCNGFSFGHVKEWSHGKIACDEHAGTKTRNPFVTWDAATWDVKIKCQLNADNCPGGTTTLNRKRVDIQISGADKKSGAIPVAILTHPDDNNSATVDDASTVDPASVCFGEPDSDLAFERDCTLNSQATLQDVDKDGDKDLMLHYEAQQTGIDPADSTACLTGKTFSGDQVEGCGPLPKG
jgi:hypothetical protein